MAGRAAGVGDRALDGQELPVVVRRMEGQAEDAPHPGFAELAVDGLLLERPKHGAARPDDDLAQAARTLDPAVGVLRGESLVVVVVAVDDQLGASRVELLPEGRDVPVVAVLSRAETRVMPDRKRAMCAGRGEVLVEPSTLG